LQYELVLVSRGQKENETPISHVSVLVMD
jgi:hypothetical protein